MASNLNMAVKDEDIFPLMLLFSDSLHFNLFLPHVVVSNAESRVF